MEFGGLSIALSSLKTHQRALEIAANNVANDVANTAGYSRQAADMTTLGNGVVPPVWSESTGEGNGVQISTITRFRNAFLEIQAGAQHASLANLDQANATLQQVRNVFAEPSDSGLGAQISDLWSAWDAVANNPGDPGARAVPLQQATTVATSINAASATLQNMKDSETRSSATSSRRCSTTSTRRCRAL